jgi:hypothetical protein
LHGVPIVTINKFASKWIRKNFEVYYREEVRQILDKLQSAMLVSSQLEAALAEIGECRSNC